jgi:hypothetical protein
MVVWTLVLVACAITAPWEPAVVSAGAPELPAALRAAAPQAAPSPNISVLNVDIWPEHDDPRVLIIYRGQLSANVPLPYRLTFAVPPSGQVNAAAYRAADGTLLQTQYQYRQEGDQLLVDITLPERGFQFEYYADLITGRPGRTFAPSLVFPLPVDALRVSVEQPLRASGFALTPPAASSAATQTGLTHHTYDARPWPAGTPWTVRVAYDKADDAPSLPRAVQPPPGPAPRPGPRAGRLWPWGWAAIAAAVLGAASFAGWWILGRAGRSGRSLRAASSGAQASRPARGSGRGAGGPQTVYCTNCGQRARSGDRFCSRCGRPLQRE